MESAALALLISSMGVMFGWQPMPDGSDRYEYVVQIEPELAATLQAGQSIPITSDIPDDIGPIGRIRIVVGRDELPRQKLATNLKPWPRQEMREGLLETQYRVEPVQASGGGRYANQTQSATNNAILPPSETPRVAANPFGKTLQQGAQDARNLAADVKQQIFPPADQLFGSGAASGQGVKTAIDNTTTQLRRGFEQGVQQVADRADQKLRAAADQFGRPAAGERSILNAGQNSPSGRILPPPATPRSQANSGQTLPKAQRIDQPIQPRQPERWQQDRSTAPPANFAAGSSPPRANPTSQPGVFNAPWPSTGGTAPADTRASDTRPSRYDDRTTQPVASAPTWQNDRPGNDPFDVANRRIDNSAPRYGNNRQPRYNTATGNTTNGNTASSGMDGPQLRMPTQQAETKWPTNPTAPEIRRDMLDQPVGEVQTVSTAPGYQQPMAQQPMAQQQTTARLPIDAQPQDLGWNQGNTNTKDSSKTLFPLLLSWVLLSGSGAGNLYLFWSYLDVRNKYQGVVHGTPGRRDRYED